MPFGAMVSGRTLTGFGRRPRRPLVNSSSSRLAPEKGGVRGGMFGFKRGQNRNARYGPRSLFEVMGEPRSVFIDTNCLNG